MATCAAPPLAPPPLRPEQCAPRPLGSRFWALAEDSSDDEGPSPSPSSSVSPARRPPAVTVGDFICSALLSPVMASRSGRGRRKAFAPGGRVLSWGASRPAVARRPPSLSPPAPSCASVEGGLDSDGAVPERLSCKDFPPLVVPVLAPPVPRVGSPAAAVCPPESDPDPDLHVPAADAPVPACPSGVGGPKRSASGVDAPTSLELGWFPKAQVRASAQGPF
jgi:hypothetical protein